jgi:hypothetical protein
MKTFILEYLLLGAFCHIGKFIFLKSTKNTASFDSHEVHIVKKKISLDLYIVYDPKCFDQR